MTPPVHVEMEDPRGLAGTGLVVPSIQPEPLPIRALMPAPCTQKCPAGIQVKAYVSLIAEERFAEALEVVRRRCSLPGICGRICHHPCEAACRRGAIDQPVAIRSLKRFVADLEREFPLPAPPPGPDRAQRVAVIGSGPAGLTAAYDLRLAGYPVTVFEGEDDPGGMLRYGITAYRLPRDILDAEIDVLVRAGVEIKTGRRLGRDFELQELGRNGFAATLLAVGAQHGRPLGVDGDAESPEVEDALAFLRRVNAGEREEMPQSVLVIGGGSTAVEAARAARRLGADSVEILYRRSEEELLTSREEVLAAMEEGVRFRFLVAPVRIVRQKGRFVGLECSQVGLGEADRSGRRRPILIPGTEFVVRAQRVFAAVGQEVDWGFLPTRARSTLTSEGDLLLDSATAMTKLKGVFAAGDMVTGPATVIDAIAAGHRASESIRHFIEEGRPGIREERPERRAAVEYGLPDTPPLEAERRHPDTVLPVPGREFHEVEQAYSAEAAVAEAQRCMRCGPCGECRICAKTCNRRHITMEMGNGNGRSRTVLLRTPASIALSLSTDGPARGTLLPTARPGHLQQQDCSEGREIFLRPARAHVNEAACRGCGSCVEVCSFNAIQVVDRGGGDRRAWIEPALCRGCNLCTAVCPTGAAESRSLAESWWEEKLQEINEYAKPPAVILACQRRTGSLEDLPRSASRGAMIVRFRCLGEVDAGMLLRLINQGAERVLVAGCGLDRCRFDGGSEQAAVQVKLAKEALGLLGLDSARVDVDWSPNRANDPLEPTIAGLVGGQRTSRRKSR